jgi:hypothetical protein
MKKLILVLGVVISISSFAQNVITENNGRVIVKNANDSIIAQIADTGSGAIAATFNDNKTEIAVVYNNGDVLIKKSDGTEIVQLAEGVSDKAITAIWVGDNIIITTLSGQKLNKNALEWR